jgi:2,3-bisphosphoglycerate-dependent phosphoglycerate mutase
MTQTPIPKTTFIVIRHGETIWNAQQRVQGHGDSSLTPKGRQDALALSRRLKNMDFDRLISSDLGRAIETATMIVKATGYTLEIDQRLRERHYGALEGLTVPQIQSSFPEAYERLRASDPDYIIPQGESRRQHYERTIAYFKASAAQNPGATIAIVAHGGVLDNLFRFVTDLPLDRPTCFMTPNTGVNVIVHGAFGDASRWVIQSWGDVAHLAPELPAA